MADRDENDKTIWGTGEDLCGEEAEAFIPGEVRGSYSTILGCSHTVVEGSHSIAIACHHAHFHGDRVIAIGCEDMDVEGDDLVLIGGAQYCRNDLGEEDGDLWLAVATWLSTLELPGIDEEWLAAFVKRQRKCW